MLGSSSLSGEVQHHVHAPSLITQCAGRFLKALDENQRAKVTAYGATVSRAIIISAKTTLR